MKKLKQSDEKRAPLPKDKPKSYWGSTHGISDGENPQKVRQRKELNEENLEQEPKFRKRK